MHIESIEISDAVLEKLERKHGVAEREVYEVLWSDEDPVLTRRSDKVPGRYVAFGRTNAGRYLAVSLAPRSRTKFAVVSARDMNDAERRFYQRHE
ncbi:MAG: BrnT family toxin [Chloroflexi bacterium]|nr:BrnT family toxin [Chloroflexota bacterium]